VALAARLPVGVAALWWGSLTTIGFLVVPLLFLHLPTPAIAGAMAAALFKAQTWVGVVCGLLLLVWTRRRAFALVNTDYIAIICIAFGMLLALLLEFAVAPRIMARDNLRLWHMLGSVMYVLQWLCAGATFWKLIPEPPTDQV
jgi:Domain of unknown function (DUF4149)